MFLLIYFFLTYIISNASDPNNGGSQGSQVWNIKKKLNVSEKVK